MPKLRQKILTYGCTGMALVAVSVIFLCSRDYNPFTDLTNAKVHVLSWSFQGRDSVSIYETGTFKAVVALREEVDSFSFSSPKNRFWKDTTVKASAGKIIDGGPYFFRVSFFDTGRDTVTLRTYRSNGEILPQDFSIRVHNPLLQEKIRDNFGDTVYLSTLRPVPDTVLYHWRLGDNWRTSSVERFIKVSLPFFNPISGQGWLWVTDLAGQNESPAVSFYYVLSDTSKPIITCRNEGLQAKTIISGDTVFAFKALITDAGTDQVEICSVNQEAFDYSNPSSHIYTKLFSNLPQLTKNNTPISIVVYAMDNTLFKNESRDTFSVVFRPGAATTPHVSVNFFFPAKDTTTVSTRTSQINGNVQSDRGDSMLISVQVNGIKPFPSKIIAGEGNWSWFVPLDNMNNPVIVSALSLDGRSLASSQRVIIFDPNAIDTINPIIWEVSTEEGTLIGSQFYTEKSDLPLRVVAFDGPSGIAKMIINNDTLQGSDTTFIWNWTYRDLSHGNATHQGNSLHILAVDKKGNLGERLSTIYLNTLPTLTSGLDTSDRFCMDTVYSRQLSWRDKDGDAVRLDSLKYPTFMKISQEGAIEWSPQLKADTTKDTLIFALSDAFGSNKYTFYLTSFPCNRSSAPLVFTTRDGDFPKVLQAGRDSLNITLSVNTAGISFTPRYSARFLDKSNNTTIIDNSGVLLWVPEIQDTGFRKLMVTVGNGIRDFDTLYAAIQVVPKNQYRCSLSAVFSGTTLPMNGLDLFSHPAPETLFLTIHDQDNPLTESYSVTVSLGALQSVATLDQKDFFVAIAPKTSISPETLSVTVTDRSGSTESLRFYVQYALPTTNSRPWLIDGYPKIPVYFCADSLYADSIRWYDPNGDIVDVIVAHAPPDMKVSKRGIIEWTPSRSRLGRDSLVIRLFDQHDTTEPHSWQLNPIDCSNKPNPVRFQTRVDDFPKWLQAETDSVSIQLKTMTGTGTRPITFSEVTDNRGFTLTDTIGKVVWKPTNRDTGMRTLRMSVKDLYDTGDSLFPQINVVPRNGQQCHLSYTYSGTILPSGFLYLSASDLIASTPPESALFTIRDQDNPLTEQYAVKIAPRSAQPTTLNLPGSTKSFSVKVASNSSSGTQSRTKDTIVVSIRDKSASTDTSVLVIQYPISAPSDIPQLNISLNSSTGVNTQSGNNVSRWSDGTTGGHGGHGGYSDALAQSDYDRQPTLVTNAVNGNPAIYFDHQTDNGDDGIYNSSFGQWADTPFTVFVVFSANSIPAGNRQTLLSTNTTDGFGLGIACNGKIGIFNDKPANTCPANDSASTNLAVMKDTWYVATFQSSLGITVGGNIRVQAWLNGTAGSQQMNLKTMSDAGLMIGTGGTDYGGSFDGYIAAFAIYERVLSGDERSLVERYLGSQYKITIH